MTIEAVVLLKVTSISALAEPDIAVTLQIPDVLPVLSVATAIPDEFVTEDGVIAPSEDSKVTVLPDLNLLPKLSNRTALITVEETLSALKIRESEAR